MNTENALPILTRTSMFALVLVLATLALPSRADRIDDDELPFQLAADLSTALKAKADRLWAEKNEQGLHFQRGSYSKKFKKIDDGTYQAMFVKDIASEDRMRTERYRVTLSGSGSKWEVTREELQGTYEKLIREVPGDETFHRFDSAEFSDEGMQASTGAGSLVIDYLLGEPHHILFTGKNLNFDYTPPVDLGYHQGQIWAILKQEHPENFAFRAEGMVLECDPDTCKKFLDHAFKGLRDATESELDKDLADYFNKALKDQREQRKDHPFQGFQLPLEPDRRFYNASIKRKDKDKWITMTYDNEDPWEVNIYVSDYGQVIGYPSEETRNSGIDPYEIEVRDDPDAKRYELTALQGTVEVGLEEAELLRGDVTFHIKLKRDAQEIPLNLGALRSAGSTDKATGIRVNALRDEDGEPLVFVRRGAYGGYVILNEKMPAGTEIVVRLDYETRGSIRKQTPSYAYVERGGWLPFVRYTDKIEQFDLTVIAPAKFKTLGIGTKVSETTNGDARTTVWTAKDVHFPTIIFGNYFEDSPGTKATKKDGTEIPVTIHVDRDSMTSWQIAPKNLRPLAEQAVNALNIYREIYGRDYPHGKLDIVNEPFNFIGAQAPDSIVYVGSGSFRSEAFLADIGVDMSSIADRLDSLVAHEVAHQWWGGIVGNANARHYWFIESLAEYSSALYMEILESDGWTKPEKARKVYLDQVERWRRQILKTDLMNSVQNCRVSWTGSDPQAAYLAMVYAKGPYAFHILRETFGDDKFLAFLKNLMTELAGQNIVTRDIQRVAEQSFGGNMEWFFDQWIRGTGIPEYSFNYSYRQTEDRSYIIEGNIEQQVVAGLNKYELKDVYYRGIVPITVLGKDRQEYPARVLVEGPDTPFAFKVPVKPVQITLNKYGEVLAHPVVDKTVR